VETYSNKISDIKIRVKVFNFFLEIHRPIASRLYDRVVFLGALPHTFCEFLRKPLQVVKSIMGSQGKTTIFFRYKSFRFFD
jgi:hypothetical protein